MKTLVRHILCTISALIYTCTLSAQDRSVVETELSHYEAMCKECLELKLLIASGEKIPRVAAEEMVARFVSMNAFLKKCRADMTVVQKKRFDAVGIWFTTGVRPLADWDVAIEPVRCSFPSLARSEVLSDGSLRCVPFVGTPLRRWDLMSKYVMVDFSYPSISYGLMGALQGWRWGGYLRFRSDYHQFHSASYTCGSDGNLSAGGGFWASGNVCTNSLYVTGGALMKATDWLSAFAGLGYGQYKVLWQDVDGAWALVSDVSSWGLAADAGLIFSWRRFALHAGITTISFKTAVFTCGIGVRL